LRFENQFCLIVCNNSKSKAMDATARCQDGVQEASGSSFRSHVAPCGTADLLQAQQDESVGKPS
ncbi:hypothetical protein JTL80_35415, partial [Pseudomonas aeruginosa]|nr:hypothetical protein [Pseudomonas aeruginosa]